MNMNSSESLKIEKKFFKVKDFLPLKFVYSAILMTLVALIIYILSVLYKTNEQEYKHNIYKKYSDNISKKFDIILNKNINDTFLLANSLSKHYAIKNSIKTNDPSKLDLDLIIGDIKTKNVYKNSRIEIIDKYGKNFKKSWDALSLDTINYMQIRVMQIIDFPKTQTYYYTSKVGYSIANLIPIYDNNEFIGIFVLHTTFDDIVSFMKKLNAEVVIVVNEKDSKKINQNQSFTKRFIDGHYIVNSNSVPYLERILQENETDKMYEKWEENFRVLESSEQLLTKYAMEDFYYRKKAKVFIFQNFDDIDISGLSIIKQWYIILAICLILASFFLIYYLVVSKINDLTKKENRSLILMNEDLKDKTDLLDYNEKKIENLFNAQPNLMIMHNGKEITQANKRFMGFFNRFGTFDGFKKEHKCVSELFEKFDAPNYIWNQNIEDIFWVDYIIRNPRRLYKTVMSIENRKGISEEHHFIIKLNEIKYSGNITDRVIVIALVDMTQDLPNYKSLDELQNVK